MSDFYDMVTPPEQRSRRRAGRTALITLLTVLALSAIGFLLIRMVLYRVRVQEFRSELSRSTVFAYEHDCLRADVKGEAVRVSGEHNYDVYQLMTVRSPGRDARRMPEGESVMLTYGDGAVLELWEDKEARGVYICFRTADGKLCRFHSRDMRLRDIVSRYLAPAKNAPWEE